MILAILLFLILTSPGPAQSPAPSSSASTPALVIEKYKPRYSGTRWELSFGSYEGVERFALDELQRMVQRFVPYVVETRSAAEPLDGGRNLVLVGTRQNNRHIAALVEKGLISMPSGAQGYTLACLASPWESGRKVVVIAGMDTGGVLYGVEEFNKRLAAPPAETTEEKRKAIDDLAEFRLSETPLVERRGLWSWGYVIYDYRRYLDNMARLKMNHLIIWNDEPPLNSRQLIDYAHSRGIQVVFGFHWGWGIENLDPASKVHLQQIKTLVLEKYEKDYRGLGLDGIYFQSFTETRQTKASGRTLASLVCEWINEIGGALLARQPNLRIEAGIHATSIRDNYPDLSSLNPKIQIVWEDAGVMPWSYDPVLPATSALEETLAYSRKLATFRPGSEFLMIAKGWTTLRWRSEFEHHGRFILGERSAEFLKARLAERTPRWDYVNAGWLERYTHALRFFRGLRGATPRPMTVLGLVEDGLFEAKIQPSVALLGEMLWNPDRPDQDYVRLALNPYYGIER